MTWKPAIVVLKSERVIPLRDIPLRFLCQPYAMKSCMRKQYEKSIRDSVDSPFCGVRKPRRIHRMVYASLLAPCLVRHCGAPVSIPE